MRKMDNSKMTGYCQSIGREGGYIQERILCYAFKMTHMNIYSIFFPQARVKFLCDCQIMVKLFACHRHDCTVN